MLVGEKVIEYSKIVFKLEINDNLVGGGEKRRKGMSKEGWFLR